MNFKSVLRKGVELSVVISALTALILVGCGGGGGTTGSVGSNPGGTTTASAVAMTVTPGKGIMIGANVTVLAANGTTVLGSAVTDATGIATVNLPTSAAGPFVVSVTCPATCQYFDEKTLAMVSGSANAPAMLAVVPSTFFRNVGVTAATNAAAQYAIASGPLTVTSVNAANNIVITSMGLTGITILRIS